MVIEGEYLIVGYLIVKWFAFFAVYRGSNPYKDRKLVRNFCISLSTQLLLGDAWPSYIRARKMKSLILHMHGMHSVLSSLSKHVLVETSLYLPLTVNTLDAPVLCDIRLNNEFVLSPKAVNITPY